jgi:hypothetical protein
MKVIRDSIHGDIFLEETELRIVDTLEFQRLRRVKQLGMTYLVYPSANHTRFEHALGALYLAGRLADNLHLEEEEKKKLRLAALLHDTGHGPLSHTSEELLKRHLGVGHEETTRRVIEDSEVTGVLEAGGVDPGEIVAILAGKRGYLSKAITSEYDVDRMDFLVRDAHHTGVAYGVIDLDRLLNTLCVYDEDLVVGAGGLKAVEALLVARFLMTPTVYLHHTSRIADAMFLKATERAIEEGILNRELLYRMDDYSMQNLFRSARGYVGEIGSRFDRRELFKKAYSEPLTAFEEGNRRRIYELSRNLTRWRKIEEELASEMGVEEGYVLLDLPPFKEYREIKGNVVINGKLKRIDKASPLIRILRQAQEEILSVAIYVPREYLGKFGKVELDDYLG